MEFLDKRTLFVALLLLCPMRAAAQAPPKLDAQHMIFADTPLQFLGGVGRAVQTLEAMKPEELEAARRNASSGDVSAEALLCLGYRLGISVQQDQVQALSWCQRGADQGDPVAIEELGMIYANGPPKQRDASKAIAWLTKAAALGSASAMDNIGTFYANGVGVPQDYAQALKWYLESSKAGFPPADYDLGVVYLFGQGVPGDPRRAMDLFTKAANAGLPSSMFALGSIYESGLPPIEADRKAALKWFQKGADLGETRCQGELGWAYANGAGTKRDYTEAVKWYRAAAEQGDPIGEYGLGVRYLQGQGVARDVSQAMYWFQKAADAGHADAAFNLGALLANQIPGHEGPPDFASAAKYLTIAANQDISDGQCILGLLYFHGYGVPQDSVTAYKWILLSRRGSRSCDQDEVNLRGIMTEQQLAEAKRRAAEFKPIPSSINYGSSVPPKDR